MSYKRGPNIVTDGLILSLDPANVKSFKGDATTNILTSINNSQGVNNTSTFKSNYGTEIVNIPGIFGDITSIYCNFYNDYSGGSNNCCPNIFNFGDLVASPSTTYTYQIIFKTATGYYHPNYMYRYEYNGGTYITEAGYVDGSRMTQLGDGWIHAWGTFTTTSTTNRIIPYFFHYEYGVQNKIQLAGIMLTQGTTIHEPKFFLPVNGTRGTTVATGGGLKDLSGNGNHGELVNNPTFNSANNGSILFDGVNDYVNCGTTLGNFGTSNFTINFFFKTTTTNVPATFMAKSIGAGPTSSYGWLVNNGTSASNLGFAIATVNGSWGSSGSYSIQTLGANINNGLWQMATIVGDRTQSNISIYINGIPQSLQSYVGAASFSTVGDVTNNQILSIGSESDVVSSSLPIAANMAQFQIYNRALSSDEVLQNYNATKSRFGII